MADAFQDPALRITLMPRDTNAYGTVFGGIILSYIDIAGAVGAHRVGVRRLVTISMDKVVFHHPVFVGDLISLYATPTRIGNTSITVHVVVEAEREIIPLEGSLPERVRVTEADVTYVAIDEHRQPCSIAHLRPRLQEKASP